MFDFDQFTFNVGGNNGLVIPVTNFNDPGPRTFGQDVIMCNGIVHAVSQVILPDSLLPNYYGGKGGKSSKGAKGMGWWRHERQLGDQEEEEGSSPLGRKRSLEVLLEANGDVVIQDEDEVDREDRKSRIESNLESLLDPK